MRILLDTNGYSAFMEDDPKAKAVVGDSDEVFLSVFVLGELHAGFRKGERTRRNLELLHEFLSDSRVHVLDATSETAEVFGLVKMTLERAGNRIPVHDMWIAAQAIQTGSVLVTYDTHFLRVPGLRIWSALEPG